MREWIAAQAPERSEEEVRVPFRASAGRLDRARRLLDTDATARRDALIAAARSVYLEPGFDPGAAAGVLLGVAAERGEEARDAEQALVDTLDLTTRAPSSGSGAHSAERSATSYSRVSRHSRPGIATSSSSQRMPRTPPSTRIVSTTCARTAAEWRKGPSAQPRRPAKRGVSWRSST